MTADLLNALLRPRTVALIGASGDAARLTSRPQRFLARHGFAGRVVPVNPGRATVQGLAAAARVEDIDGPVDHAYILLPADAAVDALQRCAAKGVKVVSVLADGFAEAGPEGAARQARLTRIAQDAGIMLIGPNSTGVVNVASGFSCTANAAFAAPRLIPGDVAVLSQSGSMIGMLMSRGAARGKGFSSLISVGNEAGTCVGALGRLMLDDPETSAFALFLETIRDRAALADFARGAHARGKPVVAYMIGQSEEGQALAVSHTGAMTGSATSIRAWLDAQGIAQVANLDSLLDTPGALARARIQAGRPKTVTVLTTTGGGGATVLDQISAQGIAIAGCSDAARAALAPLGIPLGHGKLVDVTMAGATYDGMRAVVDTLIADPATGLLVVAIGSSAQFNPELAVKPIVDAVAAAAAGAAPVVAVPLPHAPESLALLAAGGVAAFGSVESAAAGVAALMTRRAPMPPAPGALPARVAALLDEAAPGMMTEVSSARIFAALGVAGPRHVVLHADAAAPGTPPFGYPVVAKLVSADLPHKTEAGAIRMGLADAAAVAGAIAAMKASAMAHSPGFRLSGVLVQETCQGLGEALIGVTRDPLVGPVVTLAAGGVLAQIYGDGAVRPAPVTLQTAREMVSQIKGFALLRGYRGHAKGDLDALAHAVVAISQLARDDRVAEAEANPVLIRAEGDGVVALDALVRMDGRGGEQEPS